MAFWIVSLLIVAAVAALLLGGLWRARGGLSGAASDIAVYRDQLKEVERDLARGVLSQAEAETTRVEVSRRLLEADARGSASGAGAPGRREPAALLIVLVLLAGGAGLYALIGAPGTRDLPMTDRLAAIEEAARTRPDQAEAEGLAARNLPKAPEADPQFTALMERLREAVAQRPDDIQGLSLLATNEARLGNFIAARKAQEQLVDAKGEAVTADDLVMLIDMMVFSAGGYISPETEVHLRRLAEVDPDSGPAQYYAGLMYAQNGRPDRAFPIWRRLLEASAPDDPWVPVIRAEIAGVAAAAGVDYQPPALRGPSAADVNAAGEMSEAERQEMIRGMVEGLADRLATEGGPPEDWARLITALAVQGETDRARAILAEARSVFSGSAPALGIIEAAAAQADLGE